MRIIKEEYRHLMKIWVTHSGGDTWILRPASRKNGDQISGKGNYTFRGSDEEFAKFLMKIKAKDNESDPPSMRQKTYLNMALDAKSGVDPYIWIWNISWSSNFRANEGKK